MKTNFNYAIKLDLELTVMVVQGGDHDQDELEITDVQLESVNERTPTIEERAQLLDLIEADLYKAAYAELNETPIEAWRQRERWQD